MLNDSINSLRNFQNDGGVAGWVNNKVSKWIVSKSPTELFDGFSLHITRSESLEIKRVFSDYVLPNGTTVTPYSRLEPLIYNIEGDIFDVAYEQKIIDKVAQKVNNKLGILNNYTGESAQKLSGTLLKAQRIIEGSMNRIDNLISDGNSLFSSFVEDVSNNKKTQNMFKTLFAYIKNGTPVNVTAFSLNSIYTNQMYIQDFRPTMEKDIEKGRLRISITFREVARESATYSAVNVDKINKLNSYNTSEVAKKGSSLGKEGTFESILYKNIYK